MIKRNAACILFAVLSHFLFCGGSSEQGNSFHITGQVTTTEGDRTCRLALVPDDFNPITDEDENVIYTESDSTGNYTFEDVKTGEYYLNAIEPKTKQRLLKGPIAVKENNIPFGTDTVLPTSYIIADIATESSDTIVGVYIKGTVDFVSNINNHRTLSIPSVPSGTVDIVSVVKTSTSSRPVTRTYLENVVVNATDTVGVTYNNRPPIIASMPVKILSIDKNDGYYFDTVNATDPEDDLLSYSIVDGPDGLVINEKNGAVSWKIQLYTADMDTTYYPFTVKVTDDNGAFTTSTVTLISITSEITPTPVFLYFDSTFSSNDPEGKYHVSEFKCSKSPTQYRFVFNNQDTSEWSTDNQVYYKWNPDQSDNEVKAQMYCEDFSAPSEWTKSHYVFFQPDSLLKASTPIIEGPEFCVVGYDYSYLPISDNCNDNSTLFIITWGDGDTTHYSPDYSTDTTHMAAHAWKETGTFTVMTAVICDNYPIQSEHSNGFTVTVFKDSSMIPSPVKQLEPPRINQETFELNDTIFLHADSKICDSALYQFFHDDTPIMDKSTSPQDFYVPYVPGLHTFAYALWCEDTVNYCCYSEPANVFVNYLPDSCLLSCKLSADPVDNDGVFAVTTAVSRGDCPPSFSDCNYRYVIDYYYKETSVTDTSEWTPYSDTTFIISAELGSTMIISAQSRCGNSGVLMYESDWSSEKIQLP